MLKEAVEDALDRPPALLERLRDSRGRSCLGEIEDDVARAGGNMKLPDRIASVIAFDGRLLSASQMFLPCIDSSVQCTRKMPNLVSHSAV